MAALLLGSRSSRPRAALYPVLSARKLVPAPSARKTFEGPPPLECGGATDVRQIEGAVWLEDVGLTEERVREAEARLALQGKTLSPWWIAKYEKDARRNWDLFYMRHRDTAFKDRHYIDAMWQGVLPAADAPVTDAATLLELGCGVGNALYPILAAHPTLRGVALDFSPRAIATVLAHPRYDAQRVAARTCDISTEPFGVADGSVRYSSCLFVLSALAPETLPAVAAKLAAALEPGAHVLFRDYGRYDAAQLRFGKGQMLAPHFYVKADGTRCHYFEPADVERLFVAAGLEKRTCHFLFQQHANRATKTRRRRVFVHAHFVKPGGASQAKQL